MRIGVLSNPRAGRRPGRVARLRALCGRQPEVVYVETGPQLGVGDAVAALAARDIGVLAVYGGDGTLPSPP